MRKWFQYVPSAVVDYYGKAIGHVEVGSIRWNTTGFLPTSGCDSTTIWMHHMDADKTHREKARRELHRNNTSYIEQILEVTPHETIAVRPLNFHP